ncbi:YdgA family protein [Rodentibacter caecimuris]|uniref:GTP-binding protein n=1 Tax=Rodentibacter caecimuris TaxID=1796644 RepID=A0ABX3KZ97_9PAST|nr:hypothetical protein BKG89_02285 [Rodentibacter heylii]
MKKSKLALGLIAGLGILWLGGTWYTGQKAEQEYLRQIEFQNQQFKQLGLDSVLKVEYKNQKFERNFFSSDISDEIIIENVKDNQRFIIPTSATIYHGPLPLNRLTALNFLPVMFSFDGQLNKNDTTQVVFDAIKNDKPITFSGYTDYAANTSLNINIHSGETSNNEGNTINWSDFIAKVNLNKEFAGNVEYQADNIKITTDHLTFALKGLTGKSEAIPTKWAYLYNGNSELKLESLDIKEHYNGKEKNHISLKSLSTNSQSKVVDNFINQRNDYQINEIIANDKNYGKFNYDIELNHLDGNALNDIYQTIFALIKSEGTADNKHQSELLEQKLEQTALDILNNQPQLKISKLELNNDKGKLYGDLNIALIKDPKFDLSEENSILRQLSALNANVQLDKTAMIDIFSKIGPPNIDANTEVEKMAQASAAKGIFINNEKNMQLNIVLENGELKLNGKVIPEEQVNLALFMLAMSIGL